MGSARGGSLVDEKSRGVEVPLTAAEEARINATIDNWKRKLLDITKRNRALNFKTNKVTSVTIVDEHPAEVFRQLFIQGQHLRFAPTAQEPLPQGPTAPVIPANN